MPKGSVKYISAIANNYLIVSQGSPLWHQTTLTARRRAAENNMLNKFAVQALMTGMAWLCTYVPYIWSLNPPLPAHTHFDKINNVVWDKRNRLVLLEFQYKSTP